MAVAGRRLRSRSWRPRHEAPWSARRRRQPGWWSQTSPPSQAARVDLAHCVRRRSPPRSAWPAPGGGMRRPGRAVRSPPAWSGCPGPCYLLAVDPAVTAGPGAAAGARTAARSATSWSCSSPSAWCRGPGACCSWPMPWPWAWPRRCGARATPGSCSGLGVGLTVLAQAVVPADGRVGSGSLVVFALAMAGLVLVVGRIARDHRLAAVSSHRFQQKAETILARSPMGSSSPTVRASWWRPTPPASGSSAPRRSAGDRDAVRPGPRPARRRAAPRLPVGLPAARAVAPTPTGRRPRGLAAAARRPAPAAARRRRSRSPTRTAAWRWSTRSATSPGSRRPTRPRPCSSPPPPTS